MTTTATGPTPTISNPDTGIAKRDTKKIADVLSNALADSFTLYLKTLGVHWNVVGPNFFGIHQLTQVQYEDLDAAIDVLAERIRALGHLAPAAFGDFSNRSILESKSTIADAQSMVQALVDDNEALAKRFREAVKIADEGDDVVTADLLTQRIGRHEHNAWMLRASAA